jgi:hypothetical protein
VAEERETIRTFIPNPLHICMSGYRPLSELRNLTLKTFPVSRRENFGQAS